MIPTQDELADRAERGLIRRQWHPSGELMILNYTERCAYDGAWDAVTRQCRGLILDRGFNLVCRPFPKFFNHGEPHAPTLDLDARVLATDKLDGSLGILYPDPAGGWAVATRGSFTSDQATHATGVWKDRYQGRWEPPGGATALFEIVYPDNRIVVDYGPQDDLVLLAVLDNERGWPRATRLVRVGIGLQNNPAPPRAAVLPHLTVRQALEAEPRPGQEGLVLYLPDIDDRVKIKQDDYLRIHRLVFNLTARRVWENVAVCDLRRNEPDLTAKRIGELLKTDVGDVEQILERGPDWSAELREIAPPEFVQWALTTEVQLAARAEAYAYAIHGLADTLGLRKLDRKAAAYAIQHDDEARDHAAALFLLLDGKSLAAMAWTTVRPDHETFRPEDTP